MKSSPELKPTFVLACSLASNFKNGNQGGGLRMQTGVRLLQASDWSPGIPIWVRSNDPLKKVTLEVGWVAH